MRFPDDRKHEHKPPHAEVCVSFWLDSAMHQQLHNFAHRVQLTKSEVIRDALRLHEERSVFKDKLLDALDEGLASPVDENFNIDQWLDEEFPRK